MICENFFDDQKLINDRQAMIAIPDVCMGNWMSDDKYLIG